VPVQLIKHKKVLIFYIFNSSNKYENHYVPFVDITSILAIIFGWFIYSHADIFKKQY